MTREYTLDDGESPSEAVYALVATIENCSALDLTPLADVTDPDALDSFLGQDTGKDEATFEYCGYTITATAEEIRVEEAAPRN